MDLTIWFYWWQWFITGFPRSLVVRNLPVNAGDMGSIPGSGRSPGTGNGNHSYILAWKITWTEPGGLQSMGSQRVGQDWTIEHMIYYRDVRRTCSQTEGKKTQTVWRNSCKSFLLLFPSQEGSHRAQSTFSNTCALFCLGKLIRLFSAQDLYWGQVTRVPSA